jgi:hypothetical protein
MAKFTYFPIIKTRSAELGGYSTLEKNIRKEILPIFELTKTRLSQRDGRASYPDLEKQIEKILNITEKSKFILEVTDDEALLNPDLRNLIRPINGFKNWCDFVLAEPLSKYVIPSILFDTDNLIDTQKEIKFLSSKFKCLAVKIPFFEFKKPYKSVSRFKISNRTFNEGINELIDFIEENMDKKCSLLIFLDLGYIPSNESSSIYEGQITKNFTSIKTKNRNIALILSSFPSYVLEVCENGHEQGDFTCLENTFLETFCKENDLLYGDYAAIHPVKYPTGGGGWVPRIDFISADGKDFVYYRYKDPEDEDLMGGYERAAKDVYNDKRYSPLQEVDCFGDKQIKAAAQMEPPGKAPSFWIKVRMNLFITRKIISLNKEKARYIEL